MLPRDHPHYTVLPTQKSFVGMIDTTQTRCKLHLSGTFVLLSTLLNIPEPVVLHLDWRYSHDITIDGKVEHSSREFECS